MELCIYIISNFNFCLQMISAAAKTIGIRSGCVLCLRVVVIGYFTFWGIFINQACRMCLSVLTVGFSALFQLKCKIFLLLFLVCHFPEYPFNKILSSCSFPFHVSYILLVYTFKYSQPLILSAGSSVSGLRLKVCWICIAHGSDL